MKRTVIAIIAAFGLAGPGLPLEMPLVPGSEQLNLTIKILTFDRALAGRVGDDLVFGILYEEGDPVSLRVKAEMEKAVASKPDIRVGKIPVRATAIALDRSDRWEEALKSAEVDVAFLAPMRSVVLVRIIRLCRDLKLTTVGSLPDYPSLGTTIGFKPAADRPRILINLKVAREAGSDFNSRLLAMATVFR